MFIVMALMLFQYPIAVNAQLSGGQNNGNGVPRDTAANKTNTDEWETPEAQITYTKAFSSVKSGLDTSIHTFHRRPYSQPWYRDLGNLGSPTMNLQFTPQNPVGLSLGYHSFDVYRFTADSMRYYNTTRPYSSFVYNLGSKQEQSAQIFHTQNIKPYWNFAVNYRKVNSQGYYFTQKTNHDNFYLSTNYTSPSLQYQVFSTLIYNKEQNDENGGIVSDSFLSNSQFADRKTIPVNFYSSGFTSTTRSPVRTFQRDVTFRYDHAYTWGKRDTTYNEDSTSYNAKLIARFRISHQLEIGSQRYQFKDLRPDSLRYNPFFQQSFATSDSVFMRQEWFYVDNKFLLNGLLGKSGKQILFNAGIGNRVDQFKTDYLTGSKDDNVISNYLVGSLRKEAQQATQWDFAANVKLFYTGSAAGNFLLDGALSKDFGDKWGRVKVGLSQQLNNAPYNFTIYQNQFWSREKSFDKESTTQLFATLENVQYKISLGAKNYLISNYLYFDENQSPSQFAKTFSLTQFWLRKIFYFGHFTLDNELIYQEKTTASPVNVPRLMGRHQLAIETFIFKRQLQVATGVEVRYHSDYYANGYSAFFNQFYVQNSYSVANSPAASVFFNFKIKRFRAYLMFDQLQQLLNTNLIITKGYAAQDAMLRFGFNWVLIN